MNTQTYVLTNEDDKIMAIIQAENSTVLKEKTLKAISTDYDTEKTIVIKSKKFNYDYVLTCQINNLGEESYEEDFFLTLCEIY